MTEAELDALAAELDELIIMCGPGDIYAAKILRHLRLVED